MLVSGSRRTKDVYMAAHELQVKSQRSTYQRVVQYMRASLHKIKSELAKATGKTSDFDQFHDLALPSPEDIKAYNLRWLCDSPQEVFGLRKALEQFGTVPCLVLDGAPGARKVVEVKVSAAALVHLQAHPALHHIYKMFNIANFQDDFTVEGKEDGEKEIAEALVVRCVVRPRRKTNGGGSVHSAVRVRVGGQSGARAAGSGSTGDGAGTGEVVPLRERHPPAGSSSTPAACWQQDILVQALHEVALSAQLPDEGFQHACALYVDVNETILVSAHKPALPLSSVMEEGGGEGAPVHVALSLFKQLMLSLQALHSQHRTHLGVSPHNILLHMHDPAKENQRRCQLDAKVAAGARLAGFGWEGRVWAGAMQRGENGGGGWESAERELRPEVVWSAPEILRAEFWRGAGSTAGSTAVRHRDLAAADVYSAGACLWYLLNGGPPFSAEYLAECGSAGSAGCKLPRLRGGEKCGVPAWAGSSPDLVRLLTRMLHHDPARRPSASTVLSFLHATLLSQDSPLVSLVASRSEAGGTPATEVDAEEEEEVGHRREDGDASGSSGRSQRSGMSVEEQQQLASKTGRSRKRSIPQSGSGSGQSGRGSFRSLKRWRRSLTACTGTHAQDEDHDMQSSGRGSQGVGACWSSGGGGGGGRGEVAPSVSPDRLSSKGLSGQDVLAEATTSLTQQQAQHGESDQDVEACGGEKKEESGEGDKAKTAEELEEEEQLARALALSRDISEGNFCSSTSIRVLGPSSTLRPTASTTTTNATATATTSRERQKHDPRFRKPQPPTEEEDGEDGEDGETSAPHGELREVKEEEEEWCSEQAGQSGVGAGVATGCWHAVELQSRVEESSDEQEEKAEAEEEEQVEGEGGCSGSGGGAAAVVVSADLFLSCTDQRSVGGHGACSVLAVRLAEWLHDRCSPRSASTGSSSARVEGTRGGGEEEEEQEEAEAEVPTASAGAELDSLIARGVEEWKELCECSSLKERFPDLHFDLETALLRGGGGGGSGGGETRSTRAPAPVGITTDPQRSFVGFFKPQGLQEGACPMLDCLLDSVMPLEHIWRELAKDAQAVYLVSWNDHFLVLKVGETGCYLIDTLGERLHEGCKSAYILHFDGSDGARGIDTCSRYLTDIVAEVPLKQVVADVKQDCVMYTEEGYPSKLDPEKLIRPLQIEFQRVVTKNNTFELFV